MKIVIINGKGGSGKDSIASYVSELYRGKIKVANISSIDRVKEAARILGWKDTKDEKSRKFLSDLKRLSIDFNNFPFCDMMDKIYTHYIASKITDRKHLVFIHIREPEEIEKMVKTLKQDKNFEVSTLLVKRIEDVLGNYSDDNVDNYGYDYTINNYSDFSVTEHHINLWLREHLKIDAWNT